MWWLAAHHGRVSGKAAHVAEAVETQLIVIGEAPSEYVDCYRGYNYMTQNSCGDILLDASDNRVQNYVGESAYPVNSLADEGFDQSHGLYCVGTLTV